MYVNDIRFFNDFLNIIDDFKTQIFAIFKIINEIKNICYFNIHVKCQKNYIKLHQSIYIRKILQ